jgi:hypothetical protein
VSVVQNKTYLEEMLTAELRKEQPHIPPVSISSDGEFAIYNVQDRYTVRKLSPTAKGVFAFREILNGSKKHRFSFNHSQRTLKGDL